MSYSVLFLSYGQSNADCHAAGPPLDSAALDDPRIVYPNDGYGFRGVMGRARQVMMDGFVASYGFDRKFQSMGVAAAARYLADLPADPPAHVIVRSAGRGGRPLVGYVRDGRVVEGIYLDHEGQHSPLLRALFDELRLIKAEAARAGAPLRQVYIPFFHGEADRLLGRAEYVGLMVDLMDAIGAYCAELQLPVFWLLTQASGTGTDHTGNAWPNRIGIIDVAQTRPDAAFASANYALDMADANHLSATGKVIAGELIGARAAAHAAGRAVRAVTVPKAVVAQGAEIDVTFDAGVELTLDRAVIPAAEHTGGFCVRGQAPGFVTKVMRLGPAHLRLVCKGPVPAGAHLDYAYARRNRAQPGEPSTYPYGRGAVRHAKPTPSVVRPGQLIHDWLPGFSRPIAGT